MAKFNPCSSHPVSAHDPSRGRDSPSVEPWQKHLAEEIQIPTYHTHVIMMMITIASSIMLSLAETEAQR